MAAALAACAMGNNLRLALIQKPRISGHFDLILYGGTRMDDPRMLAVLDRADDTLSIRPVATVDAYRVEPALDAEDAIGRAVEFFGRHNFYDSYSVRAITTPAGAIAGYELRPSFEPFHYALPEMAETSYYFGGEGVVRLKVRERTADERMIFPEMKPKGKP